MGIECGVPHRQNTMARHISYERKTAYYLGMGLMILGGILFASTFVTFAMRFGDFSNFESNAKSEMFRAFGGMALLIVGGIIRAIGARELAGSGVVLDPRQADRRLSPRPAGRSDKMEGPHPSPGLMKIWAKLPNFT